MVAVWTAITTSIKFYSEVFGWSAKELELSGRSYWQFVLDDTIVGGMYARADEGKGNPKARMPYFSTIDLDAQVEKCQNLGGSFELNTVSEPGIGRFTILADMERNLFGLVEFE